MFWVNVEMKCAVHSCTFPKTEKPNNDDIAIYKRFTKNDLFIIISGSFFLPQLHHQHRCPSWAFHCGVFHDTHDSYRCWNLVDSYRSCDHFDTLLPTMASSVSDARIRIDIMVLQCFVQLAVNYGDMDFLHWHIHVRFGYDAISFDAVVHMHRILLTITFFYYYCSLLDAIAMAYWSPALISTLRVHLMIDRPFYFIAASKLTNFSICLTNFSCKIFFFFFFSNYTIKSISNTK